MTKVIEDLELLKKLAPYLEDVETEYYIDVNWNILNIHWPEDLTKDIWIKTLTLEEAIETVLPKYIFTDKKENLTIRSWISENIEYWNIGYFNIVTNETSLKEVKWETLLQAIQKMLEYLIDNNLLLNK